ncbi:hypothetical protein [Acinetobacter pittii]|uniref:hypothetical protein n=1 Tax=Acinetobacter pittii TaxID=48296 RepID=UPI0018D95466|nr:hypothetical protein [Acinetobacter pittii]QRF07523.1 hypothetical protein HRJ47_05810 [Acinetobacter pittii]
MANNLKEKIRDVVFWICAGGAIYLIVAFLMKTDWLSSTKKLSELYEIIRDTLTLMAYFLAPAAAFTLFNDWREEHQLKTTLTLLSEIKDIAGRIEDGLLRYDQNVRAISAIPFDKVLEYGENYEISYLLIALSRLYIEIDEKDESLKNFKLIVKDFKDFASKSVIEFKAAATSMQLYRLEEKSKNERVNALHLKCQYEEKLMLGEEYRWNAISEYNKMILEFNKIKSLL